MKSQEMSIGKCFKISGASREADKGSKTQHEFVTIHPFGRATNGRKGF